MAEPYKRHGNSILAEWVLKLALIFYVASLFFDDNAIKFMAENGGSLGGVMTYLQMTIVIVFGIVISAISQSAFKIVGFTTIIIAAFLKLIFEISSETFMAVDVINLADEILLIAGAIFYLYRHHRHEKKSKKVVKIKKRHK
jgi:hypothetical protein